MKIKFTDLELKWLHEKINHIAYLAGRNKDADMTRVACKMRYKFTPNASMVNLGKRERALIVTILAYRAENMEGALSDEAPFLRALMQKLVPEPSKESTK